MNPILFDFGIIRIYWYSVFIFLGILVGGTMVLRESRRFNIPENFMLNLFFWIIPFSLIGARLYYVIFNWSLYSGDLTSIFRVWEGGLAIHGGIIAGLLFTIIYTRRYKINTLFILDFIVVGLIIGQAIGRWGNFFNGEAHGGIVAYDTLRKMFLPDFIINGMHIDGNYYQPTFLYESLWCLLGFILLLIIRRLKYIKIGQLTCSYLIWYGVGRFLIESLRTDSLMIGGFRAAQIVSVLMLVAGIALIIVFGKGSKFNNQYNDVSNVDDIKF
jgi:phosphatidylglycerol:prolipoprotein diacylglycerol transferase